mgnify:CR=1 FL=1
MLAKRIIPTLLCRGRQLVKGIAFDSWRSVGLAAQAVRIHSMRGVDELVLLDITATQEGRGPDLDLVKELSEVCFMPLSVGGGVRSIEDARALLAAGADKIVIGSGHNEIDDLTYRLSSMFGSQAIAVAIDVKRGNYCTRNGKHDTQISAKRAAMGAAACGAGEIILTSIDREGTLLGYDLDLIESISRSVSIPVIANGGCGSYEHMNQAIEAGADAVAAGAMFQFCEATPKGAAEYLNSKGVEARIA